MIEIYVLFFLAFTWITFAVVQDLKTREIANWLNFSLVIFALGIRFFYSFFSEVGFSFFLSRVNWFWNLFYFR
jgi:Flp pilus assembly protein protease CpaA